MTSAGSSWTSIKTGSGLSFATLSRLERFRLGSSGSRASLAARLRLNFGLCSGVDLASVALRSRF